MSDPVYRIEALRDSHDRAAFHCGVPELDDYFHYRAGQDLRRKVATPFVSGRLAVSRDHRGQKLGRLLLLDALHRSWKNTAEVASIGVVVEALDENARAFYQHHEFVPLADHPNNLFLPMRTIGKAFRIH